MKQRELIAYIARRLPHQTQRDVQEIIEILSEYWLEKLVTGESIDLPDIGRVYIEIQQFMGAGIPANCGQKHRVIGRFRPIKTLKEKIKVTA